MRHPPQSRVAVAARASLRVLPLILPAIRRIEPEFEQRALLLVFRAAHVCWTAANYADEQLGESAIRAAVALDDFEPLNGIRAREALVYACRVVWEFAANEPSFLALADAAGQLRRTDLRFEDFWSAVDADLQRLLVGRTSPLASDALWLVDVRGSTKYKVNFPPWARAPWDEFKVRGVPGFKVWINWYEARLVGRTTGGFSGLSIRSDPNVDRYIARQDQEFWEDEPQAVSDRIADALSSQRECVILSSRRDHALLRI